MILLSTGELSVLDFIQEHLRCGFLDWFLPKFTLLGSGGILWILIALTLLFVRRYRVWGVEMAAALIGCLVLGNLILKPWIARIRPYDANPIIQLLVAAPIDFSFPSGHTYASFASATVLLFHKKSWGMAALIVAILIAFSRLYLYVHYPTDVLAGLVMGVVLGMISHWVVQKLIETRAKPPIAGPDS